MTPDPGRQNPLDRLAAGAPVGRMRARLEALISEPPTARRAFRLRPVLASAAVLAAAAALALLLWPSAPLPEATTVSAHQMLEAPDTFERLRGVNLAARRIAAEPALHQSLLRLVEVDRSVNVRLAALQALLPHTRDPAQIDRLVQSLGGQQTAIVQAHLGHQLRRRDLLSEVELSRILTQPGILPEVRNALTRSEDL